ncbi:hypothetical protein AGMMS50212_11640 [Spirochaetia bacterium]|nr:hypothetical protein AGMMS50212_11640 [Spirochaetia bacterium]
MRRNTSIDFINSLQIGDLLCGNDIINIVHSKNTIKFTTRNGKVFNASQHDGYLTVCVKKRSENHRQTTHTKNDKQHILKMINNT